jgi:hypothetical protein
MATFLPVNVLVDNLAIGAHVFGTNTIKAMLTNSAPSQSTTAVKTDITEISAGNGYTAGGVNMNCTKSRAGNVETIAIAPANPTWTANTSLMATFRYVVFYDDTASGKPVLGYFDHGSTITLNGVTGETYQILSSNLFTITAT